MFCHRNQYKSVDNISIAQNHRQFLMSCCKKISSDYVCIRGFLVSTSFLEFIVRRIPFYLFSLNQSVPRQFTSKIQYKMEDNREPKKEQNENIPPAKVDADGDDSDEESLPTYPKTNSTDLFEGARKMGQTIETHFGETILKRQKKMLEQIPKEMYKPTFSLQKVPGEQMVKGMIDQFLDFALPKLSDMRKKEGLSFLTTPEEDSADTEPASSTGDASKKDEPNSDVTITEVKE